MITYTVTKYGREDYEDFDNMSRAEVIELLENLEGSWVPKKPKAYYSGGELDELDYYLVKCCKALELAVKWLKEENHGN